MEEQYTIVRSEAEMTVEELLTGYWDGERFESLCRKCSNYGNLWSCPPYDFHSKEYLEQYQSLRLIATKILLNHRLREETITKEAMQEVTQSIMETVKERTDSELLALEKEAGREQRMLSSGGCRLCSRCARREGMPCRQRGRMRYSLESLGCNVSKLLEEKLGIRLLWIEDRLPDYFVLVNGMLIRHISGHQR